MFCPSCGKENASTSGYCQACGRQLTPVPGVSAAPGPAAAPAQSPVITQPMQLQRKRNPALIVVLAIAVAVAVGAGAFLFANIDREAPEQRIGRLMREAAGIQPIHNSFFSRDRQFDDTFREQYRNLFRINKEYVEAVSKLDISATAQLGTPESFADPATAAEGLKQLHAAYDLDTSQEEKLQEVINNIRQIIENNNWSGATRQAFENGFNQGIAEPLARRKRATSAEAAWIQSIDDVYSYAENNHAVFVLNGGQLQISDNQVLEDFNSKIRTMNARRSEFFQAKQDFDKWQADLFKKMGVSGSDVGLPK
jgi:hypothetical protein